MNIGPTRKISLAALVMVVVLAVAGCGGGGGDTATVPSTPLAPSPGVIETGPVTSVLAAVFTDVNRKAAFERLNAVREQAGLGLLAQNSALDQAAQAHSGYQAADGFVGHVEVPGKTGFTGVRSTDRALAAGYQAAGLAEVAAAGETPLGGGNLIDMLMGGPYHRMGMLLYRPVDMGVGFVRYPNRLGFLTVLLGRTSAKEQGAPATDFVIWPVDNATGIPYAMWQESPNPIPENNGQPAGYAASIQVNDLFRAIEVDTFSIRGPGATVVETKLLTKSTDENLSLYSDGDSFAAALPRQPLAKNTPYTVSFTGWTVLRSTGARTPISKTWSFTTSDRADY